jgi:hypothetical protein
MSQAQSAQQEPETNWPVLTAEKLRTDGPWATFEWLKSERDRSPRDLALRGYIEIVRNIIVRDFLANPQGSRAVPRLSPDFLVDFVRFNLTAKEGYLISLIDGRTNVEQLLKLSPFDPFTTLLNLARLQRARAIVVPQ